MNVRELVPGFVDELEKIAVSRKTAMIGALLGGAAGMAMSGPTTRSKILNTAVGAGTGHIAGKVLKGAKRGVWDEPQERAHRDLYGYQPSTVTQDQGNFQ